ncbi:cytochrome c oxidase subunit 7C, mitochondrial-like [Leptopilina heterotoma]|uniref:cytochrome c oxidase subunit 7C, mitochondrial-like n=1 Tax=Leptopilina heterotoma TaxID=63436 RepID=UPI001CA84787|nr:cytochrome c oxidase subunit 7C, mitochondrial-like [Leptopilina heterotoma]
MLGQISRQSVRRFATSAVRKSSPNDGVPGKNIPFNIENKSLLTLKFMIFFGSGFAVPFIALRHQMLKA